MSSYTITYNFTNQALQHEACIKSGQYLNANCFQLFKAISGPKKSRDERGFEFQQGGVKQNGKCHSENPKTLDYGSKCKQEPLPNG
jgi:hypothetical protein